MGNLEYQKRLFIDIDVFKGFEIGITKMIGWR
jgi:hypothetical protein